MQGTAGATADDRGTDHSGRERFFSAPLAGADPELAAAITDELDRQQQQIELIASENIVSRAVLEAQGSVLTNKYAEGYPGRRYYGGCEYVDVAERLAIERATKLFDCAFANVQPHSGAQANQAVFMALLKPGDTILGMSLDAGGHLTHGAAPNQSGKWFNAIGYGVREADGLIDLEQVEALARGEEAPRAVYPWQIAFNVIPQVDAFLESGYTKEEMKLENEGRKIMGLPDFRASVTCVRVPVYRAHSVAVSAEFERPVSVAAARAVLEKASGLRVVDEPSRHGYPVPLQVAGKDDCEIGRLRVDCALGNGLSFWICGDQLLKGAALNAVQIAELLVE